MDKTLEQLRKKMKHSCRMPSIVAIHNLLTELGIEHEYRESQNVVEYRSKGNRYVNSRHMGKRGYKIVINTEGTFIHMDTSDSYYSWNSAMYARELMEIIDKKKGGNNG